MMESSIYIISFLSGLFIFISVYILFNVYLFSPIEKFTSHSRQNDTEDAYKHIDTVNTDIQSESQAPSQGSSVSKSQTPSVSHPQVSSQGPSAQPQAPSASQAETNEQSFDLFNSDYTSDLYIPVLPLENDNFMLLTTYENAKQLSNSSLRWYDSHIDVNNIIMTDFNKGIYFSQNNTITLVADPVLAAKGADIHRVELTGPIALYFANNNQAPFSLSEFTVIFMMKFRDIVGSSTLLEMLCNTVVIDDNDEPTYIPNAVSINIAKTNERYVQFDIIFGTEKYTVPDIHRNLLVNDDIVFIAMTFDASTISLIVNNNVYKFEYKKPLVSLGSLPVVINKSGELNCILYSMAYYKKVLTDKDIIDFRRYNLHYLTGMHMLMKENIEYQKMLALAKENSSKNQNNLKDVSQMLDKCVIYKNEAVEKPPEVSKKPRYSLPVLQTPYPSKM